jgi:hypothetical protein
VTVRASCAVLAASVVLAGCASMPESRPESPSGKVAVTDAQASRVFARYDEVNNAANADLDSEAIETIEAGPLLESSLTAFRLAEASDDEPAEPYYHTDTVGYSPRFDEYPMWFVATTRINSDPGRITVLSLTRESANDEWVAEQAANLGGVELPAITLVDGATLAPSDDQVRRVTEVLGQTQAYLSGGDAPAGVDVSSEGLTSYRSWAEDSTIQLDEVGAPEISCETDDRVEVRVLPTDTGALGVATVRCVLQQSVLEDVPGEMTLGGELSVLAPDPGRTVEFISSHPLVVVVPDTGDAEVLSGGWRWADVVMSPE